MFYLFHGIFDESLFVCCFEILDKIFLLDWYLCAFCHDEKDINSSFKKMNVSDINSGYYK